jgi:hypothetical protein
LGTARIGLLARPAYRMQWDAVLGWPAFLLLQNFPLLRGKFPISHLRGRQNLSGLLALQANAA